MTPRIAVMGVGGIGGCIGGRLAAANADILFIARGAHLDALQRDGLRLTSALGDLHLPRIHATADPGRHGVMDYVIFAVKGPQTRAAAETIGPIVGPDTAIVTFQNGVEGIDLLQQAGQGARCRNAVSQHRVPGAVPLRLSRD